MFDKWYTVKPEYAHLWGENCYENTLVSEETVHDLSSEWETPLDELLHQLNEVTVYTIDGTRYIAVERATYRNRGVPAEAYKSVHAIIADDPADEDGIVDLYELTDFDSDGDPTEAHNAGYGWLLREQRII